MNMPDNQGVDTTGSYGWLWIVGIIVIVAVILFLIQRSVPKDTVVAENNETIEEIVEMNVINNFMTPKNVTPLSIIGLGWEINAADAHTAEYTAVHWGTVHIEDSMFNESVGIDNPYAHTEGGNLSGEFEIPDTFEANIQSPKSGTIYLRAHATINGVNYWSDERAITIDNK